MNYCNLQFKNFKLNTLKSMSEVTISLNHSNDEFKELTIRNKENIVFLIIYYIIERKQNTNSNNNGNNTNTNENYDNNNSDVYVDNNQDNGLSASAGSSGFSIFPKTFLGWLVWVLVILAAVIIVGNMRKNEYHDRGI